MTITPSDTTISGPVLEMRFRIVNEQRTRQLGFEDAIPVAGNIYAGTALVCTQASDLLNRLRAATPTGWSLEMDLNIRPWGATFWPGTLSITERMQLLTAGNDACLLDKLMACRSFVRELAQQLQALKNT